MRKSDFSEAFVAPAFDFQFSSTQSQPAGTAPIEARVQSSHLIEAESAYSFSGTPLSNLHPTLSVTQLIATAGAFPSRGSVGDSYWSLGAVHHFAGNFAPTGTVMATGGLYAISQNTALFSLLGTYFGGDGKSTFAVPDLSDRLSIGWGQGNGLSERFLGEAGSAATLSLVPSELPVHVGGGAQLHDNMQPYNTLSYVINARGTFPSEGGSSGGALNLIGTVWQFAGNFDPGDMIICDGRLLNIAEYEELFTVIGTTFGGDGQDTFAVPDLRGRTIIGAGISSSGTTYTLGQTLGLEIGQVLNSNLPANMGGAGTPINNIQPALVLNHLIALGGVFPSVGTGSGAYGTSSTFDAGAPVLGEMVAYAGSAVPQGWAFPNGQFLPINQNQALFSILGTTYGGNGQTTFALPDLRGRSMIGASGEAPLGTRQGSETMVLTSANIPSLNYSGSATDNTLYGGDSDDIINGLAGNDTINANGGDDILIGGEGNDTLDGGTGLDTASYATATARVIINLGLGVQETEGAGVDTFNSIEHLIGSNHNDILIGSDAIGNYINGGTGNDYLAGRLGDDTLVGGAGDDTIYGEDGIDTASYFDASTGVVVNLSNLSYQNTGGAGLDYLDQIENLTGSNFADTLTGDANANVLDGGAGNDTLNGNGGLDTLVGGTGDDLYIVDASGAAVTELVNGGTADELRTTLNSYTAPAHVEIVKFVGTGSFTGTGDNLANIFWGGSGSDMLSGLGGNDTLYFHLGGDDAGHGGDGGDFFYYGAALTGADVNDGGAGNDTLILQGNGAFNLSSTNLVDIEGISLQSGSITRWGDTAGNLYDFTLVMNDANVAGGQQLRVNGQSLLAGEDFTFDGSAEVDGSFLIYGGAGVDTLTGGARNDIFFFEAGRFGSGADRVVGGAGNDAVVISGSTAASPSLLTLNIASGSFTSVESLSFNGRFASDPLARPSYEITFANGNIAAGAALIVNASSLNATQFLHFNGSAETQGRFTMYGGAGLDVLVGGANKDVFYAAGGRDSMTGGAGGDTFQFRSTLDSTVAQSDRIEDFQSSLDKIDLRSIDAASAVAGDQAFAFIGAAAFGGVAGQLRATYEAGLNRYAIQGDVNGDGVADFQIYAFGATLAVGDFLL